MAGQKALSHHAGSTSSLLEGTDRGMVLQEGGWSSAFNLGIDELHSGLEKLCGSVEACSLGL